MPAIEGLLQEEPPKPEPHDDYKTYWEVIEKDSTLK